jgi:hypothetical protein
MFSMDGVPANYKGRFVSKENFRTFIYAADGSQKLVTSWDEYEKHMETGIWFATRMDATPQGACKEEKPKRTKKTVDVKKGEPIDLVEQSPVVEILESSIEVLDEDKEDDFLPKASK